MGNSFSVDSKLIERSSTKDLRIGAAGMQGRRAEMEDAHLIVSGLTKHPQITVCGVFDGHCGSLAAKYLSEHLAGAVDELREPMDPNQLKQCLVNLDQKFHTENPNNDSGATVALVLIQKQANGLFTALFANAGDSRVSLIDRNTAEIQYMSKDHKPEDKAELTRIKKAGGEVYNGRVDGNLNLSRSFGDWPYKINAAVPPLKQRISVGLTMVKIENVRDNHCVLIYCDGFTETKAPDQELVSKVADLLHKNKDLAMVAAQLCDAIPSNDNMTMMVVSFDTSADQKEMKNQREYLPGKVDPKNEEYVKFVKLDAIHRGSLKPDSEELKLFMDQCAKNYLVQPKKEESEWKPSKKTQETKEEKNPLILFTDPLLGFGEAQKETAEKYIMAGDIKEQLQDLSLVCQMCLLNMKRNRTRANYIKHRQSSSDFNKRKRDQLINAEKVTRKKCIQCNIDINYTTKCTSVQIRRR